VPAIPSESPAERPRLAARDQAHGFRILARRDAKGVRLITRNGNDFTKRLLLVVASVMALLVRSCLIDGEAIVSDGSIGA
jgi:ATP-dependent DNA ligase